MSYSLDHNGGEIDHQPQGRTSLPPRALFSAAEIAAALGKGKRTVQRSLSAAGIEPDGISDSPLTRGQLAPGWTFARLPQGWRKQLVQAARRRGYRDAAHLLAESAQRFTPHDAQGRAVPLSDVAPAQLDEAQRLRAALARAIALRDSPDAPGRLRIGMEDYAREVGPITDRHWRRLFERAIERDGGAECFDDPALYVREVVCRRNPVAPSQLSRCDREIYSACVSVNQPDRPTVAEAARIWAIVCEQIAARLADGSREKTVRGAVARVLCDTGIALAKSPEAMKAAVKRKFQQWREAGGNAGVLCDKRKGRSGAAPRYVLSEPERKRAVAFIVDEAGCRIEEGFRRAAVGGLFSEPITHAVLSARQLPRALRRAVECDVEALRDIHHGPRQQRLNGPHHTRDWSGVCAGDFMQGDDTTAPVYWWEDRESGPEVMRGQWLVMIDLRSLFILAHVLIPEAAYSAVHVRGLMTRAMRAHGLPRRGFYFERNIWQRARLVTGPKDVPWEVLESSFQKDFGLVFRHAQLPRGKPVERVFGHLQNRMEALPGYVGRDERHDCYERAQRMLGEVRTGREAADAHLYSKPQMLGSLQSIVDDYNRTPQRGEMLGGMSPLEGWIKLQGGEPRALFNDRCAFLLSHVRTVPLEIRADGLRFSLNGKKHVFVGPETGARVGQRVVVYLNPDEPEVAFCEPGHGGEIFTVRRLNPLPAMDASAEDFAREQGKIDAHLGYQRALYADTQNVLPPSAFRTNIIDRRTAARGEQIAERTADAGAAERQGRITRQKISRASRAAGMPEQLVASGADRADETLAALDELRALSSEVHESGEITLSKPHRKQK
ncbi:MAG: hypothetical protein ABMA13_12340 [Chthoniobacteraceae bacterium]